VDVEENEYDRLYTASEMSVVLRALSIRSPLKPSRDQGELSYRSSADPDDSKRRMKQGVLQTGNNRDFARGNP